jgi:hypothetical protein
MSNQQPPRRPKNQSRYGGQQQLPNMATPRRPDPPKNFFLLGMIFLLAVLGGMVWLVLWLFGMGPYGLKVAEVTPTVTDTLAPSILPTLIVTSTLDPTGTPTPTLTVTIAPTLTVTPTPTLELLPFILSGEPETWRSDAIRPGVSCDWLLIAGQVWGLQDSPFMGLTLHLYGELAGNEIDRFTLTGSAATYGPSGYEFALEGLVVDSQDSLYIQLVDPNGIPLSQAYPLETFEDCEQNLILVNFKQVR